MNGRGAGPSGLAWFLTLTASGIGLFLLLCVQYATTDPYDVDSLWPLAILTGINVVVVAGWVVWAVVVLVLFDGEAPAMPTRTSDDDRLRPPTDPPADGWTIADAGRPADPWVARGDGSATASGDR